MEKKLKRRVPWTQNTGGSRRARGSSGNGSGTRTGNRNGNKIHMITQTEATANVKSDMEMKETQEVKA